MAGQVQSWGISVSGGKWIMIIPAGSEEFGTVPITIEEELGAATAFPQQDSVYAVD
jgi:hypothetical protein